MLVFPAHLQLHRSNAWGGRSERVLRVYGDESDGCQPSTKRDAKYPRGKGRNEKVGERRRETIRMRRAKHIGDDEPPLQSMECLGTIEQCLDPELDKSHYLRVPIHGQGSRLLRSGHLNRSLLSRRSSARPAQPPVLGPPSPRGPAFSRGLRFGRGTPFLWVENIVDPGPVSDDLGAVVFCAQACIQDIAWKAVSVGPSKKCKGAGPWGVAKGGESVDEAFGAFDCDVYRR